MLQERAEERGLKIERIHEDNVVQSKALPNKPCDFTIIQLSRPSRIPDWKEIDRLPIVEGSTKIVVFLQLLKDKTRGAKPMDPLNEGSKHYRVFHFIGTQEGLNANSVWEGQQEEDLFGYLCN